MPKKHQCHPRRPGYYWTTWTKTGCRYVVLVDYNGFKQFRVFVPRWSASRGIEEFEDWSGPIKERKRA